MAETGIPDPVVDFEENNTLTDEFENGLCDLCGKPLTNGQETVKQTEKGIQGLQKAVHSRGDGLRFVVGQTVHKSCRHRYCNPNVIKRDLKRKREENSESDTLATVSLRSSRPKFDFGSDCLFCGLPAKEDKKKGIHVYPVRTFNCQEKLLEACSERGPTDKWAEIVRSRIQYAQDLHAVDAVHHNQCNINFRTKKNVPLNFRTSTFNTETIHKAGRPADERQKAFLSVADFLEKNDDEQITLTDLCNKMQEYLNNEVPYTEKHMKNKLLDHFGEDLHITSIQGKANVVTFRTAADKILKQFSESKREKDNNAEKLRIIKTASKLLLADIQDMKTSKDNYPSSSQVSDLQSNLNYLPPSLVLFLKTLLHEKKGPEIKIASIGQALAQAARPKVLLAPLQIGLSIELHHLFGSKYIVEHLNKLGFCSSYAEVQRFEQCAALNQGFNLYGTIPDSRIQFVADNVDHNIMTLDGTGTFHGMGIIAAATPGTKQHTAIPRDLSVTAKSVTAVGKIPLLYFDPSTLNISLAYEVLRDFKTEDESRQLDLAWKLSWPLRSPRPGWSGTMQVVSDGSYPGQSAITFLPMIDMDPSNLSCVYSTLHFVSSLARQNRVTPILTFDQPLWWKAMVIVDSEPADSLLRSIVLRLGGFHTQMSFLGCIGRLMAGSGLQQLLEVIFAPNAVTHMLSGKSVTRAVRGHFLVDAVLNAVISSITFGHSLENDTGTETEKANETQHESKTADNSAKDNQNLPGRKCLQSVLSLFDTVVQKETSIEELQKSPELTRVEEMLLHTKQTLQQKRTPRLWLQYMEMTDILRRFLKAERTGNWHLHLHCLQEMLPYLAAAGHNLYAKSVYIYLQEMQQLKQRHPSIFHEFSHGYHVLRRSDRYWAGLSTDLVIEQVLMRSVKSAGGLTRGRGMGETQRTQWLLSMPACADMNNAMQEVSGMEFITSDQHAECGESREGKDDKDMRSLLHFLLPRNPFAGDDILRNICTGVTADASVNVDTAKAVGDSIIKSMTGSLVKEFKFKRMVQAVTMDIKTSARVDGESMQVDPQLLFQRLVTAANAQPDQFNLSSTFEFELSSPPASLFEPSGLLRESHKSVLADSIATLVKGEALLQENDDTGGQIVLDGGSLLHKVPWGKQETFGDLCKKYTEHVNRHYKGSTVVFDGYDSGASTKDIAHLRRTSGTVGPVVKITEDMVLSSRKDHFLSNPENKQAFVNMLGAFLTSLGCRVLHAKGDADTLIVQTAVRCSALCKTTVIAEDTDLLILLCFHTRLEDHPVFLRSDRQTNNKRRVWHIQSVKQCLGQEICEILPFVHAVSGCDTTSRLYGIGKGIPLKKVKSDPIFKQQAQIFCSKEQSQETIIAAGERALVSLYNGRPGEGLDTLRYKRFCEKVATCAGTVDVKSLPPTTAAAKYHSLRVYLQVQEWITMSSGLTPEQWGWQLSSNKKLEPRTTDLLPAPDDLLKMVRCGCKKDCQSKRCTCRRQGLECSVACGGCRGLSCSNSPTLEEIDSDLLDFPHIPDLPAAFDDVNVDDT